MAGSALITLFEPGGTDRGLLRSKAVPFLRSIRKALESPGQETARCEPGWKTGV